MNSYVLIKVTGKNVRSFVRRLINNNISYSKIKENSYKELYIKMPYSEYQKMCKIKTINKIEIIKLIGPIKLVDFCKNNITYVLCLLISLTFLILLSKTCFKINVIHNNKEIRDLVTDELSTFNIKKFRLIPGYEKRTKIINKIIKHNKDKIEWMEIERNGSILSIKIAERKINKEKEVCQNRSIVAKKSGVIKKIFASNGDIVKNVNDYVKKGDVIINGNIIKDDEVKKSICAKGKVYAETWYSVNIEYPLYYEEVKYLDDIKNNYIVSIFNHNYSVRKNFTTYYLEKEKVLLWEKIFPFKISTVKQRKTRTFKQKLTYNEALKKVTSIAYDKILVKLNKDEYIISKKALNFSANNSKIVVDVFFKVYEDITDYQNIDALEDIKTPE